MQKMVEKGIECKIANGKILSCIFYEPSTRTSFSFQASMLRLGGQVLRISGTKNSSISKGESLEDTVRCLECYSDIIVLRHPMKGAPERVMRVCPNTSVMNAGDGSGEHPTQAMLDLFTIYKELGKLDNICITFVGDLKYGRTVHSLSQAIAEYEGIKINFVSPEILQIPDDILQVLVAGNNHSLDIVQCSELTLDILHETNVLYVTRVQKERFDHISEYAKVKNCFVINRNVMKNCKKAGDMIVMHPLPRIDEISTEIDDDPRCVYFKQMKYGMYTRMALLALLLGIA